MGEGSDKNKNHPLTTYLLVALLGFVALNHAVRFYYSDTRLVGQHDVFGLKFEITDSMVNSVENIRLSAAGLFDSAARRCPSSLESYCERGSRVCTSWLQRNCIGNKFCPSRIDNYCHQGIYGLKVALGLN